MHVQIRDGGPAIHVLEAILFTFDANRDYYSWIVTAIGEEKSR